VAEKESNSGLPSGSEIVWYSEESFDFMKQIPKYEIWGKSGKYIVEEAAKMRTSISASVKFQNPKMKENALDLAKQAEAANQLLTSLGMVASFAEIFSSYNEICEVWNSADISLDEKILATLASSSYAGEGTCKFIAGCQVVFTDLPREVGKSVKMLGKAASGFKIAGGAFSIIKASVELSEKNLKQEEKAEVVCEWMSGIIDAIGGVLELTPFSSLAIPLGILSSAVDAAGKSFGQEKWLRGGLIIAVGIVLSALLFTLIVTFNSTIATAFGLASTSFAATLMLSVAGITIGLAALAATGLLIAKMAKSKPPKDFACGGFPTCGQPFFAREAGAELVGTLNGRNAVVNNNQIVEAVSIGVYSAFQSALRNGNSTNPIIARVYLDGKCIAMSTQA